MTDLTAISAATFDIEARDWALAEGMSLGLVVDTIGLDTHVELCHAAAMLGARDGREWDDCEEKSSAVGWYETLLASQFAEIREAEWAGENDIPMPVSEEFLDSCYMIFHECLNGVDINRSCGDGTYETLEENVTMFFDEWESLDEADCREVMRDILEGIRD